MLLIFSSSLCAASISLWQSNINWQFVMVYAQLAYTTAKNGGRCIGCISSATPYAYSVRYPYAHGNRILVAQ